MVTAALALKGPARNRGRQTWGKQSDGHRARPELSRTNTRQTQKARGAAGAGGGAREKVGAQATTPGANWDKSWAHEAELKGEAVLVKERLRRAVPGNASPRRRVEPETKEPLASIAESGENVATRGI